MFVENTEYEIMTPSGWKDFKGITVVDNKVTFKVTVESGDIVTATAKHHFFINNKKIQLKDLKVGDRIDTVSGLVSIISIEECPPTSVYDIVEVDDIDHRFVVNNCFITKNCDEFAFVRPTIAKEFWTSISPTLSTGGKAIVTSTPNSDEDQFAEIWRIANHKFDDYGNETKTGKNGFAPIMFPWSRHPDRTQAWAEQQRASIGDDRFKREHECQFIIFDETLIAPSKLALMEGINPIEKQGQVRWYGKPVSGHTYGVALDPSLGTGGDPAAIQVWDLTTMTQLAEWQHNLTLIQKQVAILREICKYIAEETDDPANLYYSVENNTIGEAALNAIADIGEENISGNFLTDPTTPGAGRRHRKGFNTSHRSKIAACAKMKMWIENDKMSIKSKSLISELKNFVAIGNSYKAKVGETDDLVLATVLIVRMAMLLRQYDADLSESLTDTLEDIMIEPMPFIIV
jgi:hypothetical protein